MRVLLVQLGRLGDVLLTTPALRALRSAVPDATLEFLTKPAFAPVLEGNASLDAIRRNDGRLRSELRHAVGSLRRREFDVVVDFQSTPHSALITYATRAPVRIGRNKRWRLGYTERVSIAGVGPYAAEHKLAMLRPLGVAGGSLRLDLQLTDADREFAAALWERLGWVEGARVAALSPVSRQPYKRWPLDRFARVGDALSRHFEGRVLITSGPGERDVGRVVASMMGRPAVWDYPATTIRQLAAVYERCALWVGNDGGPKHLACAVGTATVAIFRHGHGAAWTNPETPAQIAVEAPPGGADQLAGLAASAVLEAVEGLLHERPART